MMQNNKKILVKNPNITQSNENPNMAIIKNKYFEVIGEQ